ncbi:MAG: hypothetical protein NUV52_01730 [Candidatus Roizmanbacteria bacterium]|nr:hypothetical protein [Candidatus Roizmanbacteria bacterium]
MSVDNSPQETRHMVEQPECDGCGKHNATRTLYFDMRSSTDPQRISTNIPVTLCNGCAENEAFIIFQSEGVVPESLRFEKIPSSPEVEATMDAFIPEVCDRCEEAPPTTTLYYGLQSDLVPGLVLNPDIPIYLCDGCTMPMAFEIAADPNAVEDSISIFQGIGSMSGRKPAHDVTDSTFALIGGLTNFVQRRGQTLNE